MKQKENEAGETKENRTVKSQQDEQGNKGVKKETPESQRIPYLTLRQDQDPSAVKVFPLFILQYKPL